MASVGLEERAKANPAVHFFQTGMNLMATQSDWEGIEAKQREEVLCDPDNPALVQLDGMLKKVLIFRETSAICV